MDTIATQVAEVRQAIAKACHRVGRDPEGVRLIAVTKNQGPEVLEALAKAGVTDIGENRLEHLEMIKPRVPASMAIHYIGRVQGRQLVKLAPQCSVLHSLCSLDHAERLARGWYGSQSFPVFLQVNTSGEPGKAGVSAEALADLVTGCQQLPSLTLVGLMTMAEEGADPGSLRQTFRRLRELAQRHGLPRLSMGMSQDFAIAVEEGATEVRIGTRLFAGLEAPGALGASEPVPTTDV